MPVASAYCFAIPPVLQSMSWFFISFVVLLLNQEAVVNQCPERCLCHHGLVDCRRQSLLAVPLHLPLNTTVLDLRNNRLMKISKSDFENLEKLQLLLMSWNRIHIFEKAFLMNRF